MTEKRERLSIIDKAMKKAGFGITMGGNPTKVSRAMEANIKNAYRREFGHYVAPKKFGFKSEAVTYMSRYKPEEVEDIHASDVKYRHALARDLDPAGAAYEDAGDEAMARNSRIAQAKALTSGIHVNYLSAGVLYEDAGEPEAALKSYKTYLGDNSLRDPVGVPLAEKKISMLEKKVEAQEKRTERRRQLSRAAAAIIGIFGGLFFLSPSITGNAIGGMAAIYANRIGAVLLIIGLIAGYFWIKKR